MKQGVCESTTGSRREESNTAWMEAAYKDGLEIEKHYEVYQETKVCQ